MRMLRIVSLLLVLMLSAGVISAQDEKVLVVGHAEVIDSLDPARGYTQTVGIVNQSVYDTLVTFPEDSAASIVPRLAESWTISEDGLTYTFTLRDATFSSGNPITAADVVFSYNRLKNIKGNPSYLMEKVASVEATDDKTVTITLTTPYPVFLSMLANNGFDVLDSQTVIANGGTDAEDAAETDAAGEYLDAQSAGSGPYILDHWTKDTETVLTRNPNYWGEAPYFDRVIIQNLPEPATQKTALESGDIDIALDLTSDQMPSFEGNADITVASTPGNIIHFLIMNENPDIGGPMANPQVQLAVRYALDYDGYKTLWGGITPGTNMVVGFPDAFGEDKAFVRDIAKAKELLTEAGYPDGFEVTLTYPTYSIQGVNMDTTAQKIVEDLAEAGIIVTLNPGEVGVALEGYRNGTDAFGYWFWGPDYLDSSDVLSFMPGEKVGLRAAWTTEMVDQSILDMIEQAKVSSDPAQRTELFTALQDFLQQSGPFAPFIQPTVQTAFSSSLQGYHWHPQWIIDLAKLSRAE